MAAVVEDSHVAGLGLPQMPAKAVDDVGPRGVAVFQHLDGQIRRARLLSQPGMEMVHIVQAAGERANLGGIVVDAREQGVDA